MTTKTTRPAIKSPERLKLATRCETQMAPFDRVRAEYANSPGLGTAVLLPRRTPAECVTLKVDGDCLDPKLRHGQIVIVERKMPKSGELAVFWFKGAERPIIKILRTGLDHIYPYVPGGNCVAMIEFEQTNPPKRFRAQVDRIACIARVHSVLPEKQTRKRKRA